MKFSLRPETDTDEPFLRRLFVAGRRDEFAASGMPDAQIEMLLAQQFNLQRSHYRAAYPDADWSVVEHRGEPVGRLYLARAMDGRHLVDIAVMPQWQGKGLGAALLDRVLADAQAAGRPVHLSVRPYNPARRLYLRKGFVETGTTGADVAMTWKPVS
ncbi:GNAT family N-acetyltransferase [Sphingomonas sp. AOB5]|uniref:GNAT family N-acetyltransferase n=1 Tax=Sphingomonas sp. AOB5 TaxID=3034017 RepID=UPI0023F7D02A|nr:GNAT family N-acetyltransferase [Sphingomonas sp. AOB5]MDF7776159.1 GNAT family N-acetyltransferase [Sphingomonas sp. AOB5]